MVKREQGKLARLRARAESGDAAACFSLAAHFAWAAPRETVRWLRRAAELGHLDARATLGALHSKGRHVRRNPRAVARLLWEAAEAGSELARMDLDRSELDPDTQKELNRFRLRAASKGDVGAMYQLGSSYLRGRGGRRDPRRAARWLLEAAEGGHPKAWSGLDDLADEGFVAARVIVPLLRRAAAAGDPQAQLYLAWRLESAEGVRQNHAEAASWYRKAADQGEALAWLWLGHAFREGRGVRRSWPRALDCYRRAAARGVGHAFAWLIEYYDGQCEVPRNAGAVSAWLRRAEADAGHVDADVYVCLDDFYGYGFVDDPSKGSDPRRAVRWVQKGAAEGDPACMMRLGIHLFDGTGVPKDRRRALALYRRAAELGDSRAAYLLGACLLEGNGVRRDRRGARRWFERAAREGESDARRALAKLRRG